MASWPVRAVVLVILCFLAACGGDGGGEEEAAYGSGGPEEPAERWLAMLRHIPDTPETRSWVIMNDYVHASDALGVPWPATDANPEELEEFLVELHILDDGTSRGLASLALPNTQTAPLGPGDLKTELGFSIANIDLSIEAGVPPEKYQVLRGHFDADVIEQSVRTDPLWSELLEEATYEGTNYYRWGEDHVENDLFASPVRPEGRGHRLAQRGEFVYWSAWTEGLEAMIDAGREERRSLAHVEEFRLVAEGLDRLDTYTAHFTDEADQLSLPRVVEFQCSRSCSTANFETVRDRLAPQPLLSPFQILATGTGLDDRGRFLGLVMVYPSEETARENSVKLEARIHQRIDERAMWLPNLGPWNEVIHGFEVSSEGRLVVAKIHSVIW